MHSPKFISYIYFTYRLIIFKSNYISKFILNLIFCYFLLMIGELQIKTIKANFIRDTELIFDMKPYVKYFVGTFCLCS